MALVSESALELTSSLDLQATLLATARRLCEGVGVPECEITVIEGDELHTLMRVTDGEVDEAWMDRSCRGDVAVTREVIETKRPTVVGSLATRGSRRPCTRSTGTSVRRAGPRCR